MSPEVRICGSGRSFPAAAGDTILMAAQAAGINWPSGCRTGRCGLCRTRLVSGEATEGSSEPYVLTDSERREGTILACRTYPVGDCEIDGFVSETSVDHPRHTLDCRVEDIDDVTHDIRCLRLRIASGGPFAFAAGQFASVTFEGMPPRDYSMANRPGEALLEFHIRRMPDGHASAFVASRLQPGASVRVVGPFGTCYLRENHRGPIVAIAGGSGLAPLKAIVEQALHLGLRQPIHFYFGAREERDLYQVEHFETLARQHGNFRFVPVLSDARQPTRHRTGLVHQAVAEDLADLDGCKAYLAGPPPMLEAAQTLLLQRGLRADDLHADPFLSAAEMARAGRRTGDRM